MNRYYEYIHIAGAIDVVKEIARNVLRKDPYAVLRADCGAKYASLISKNWWEAAPDQMAASHPELDILVNKGLGKYGGYCLIHKPPYTERDFWSFEADTCSHSDGRLDRLFNDENDYLMIKGEYSDAEVKITKADGETVVFDQLSSVSPSFDLLKTAPLTLGFLASLCCGRLAKNKIPDFARDTLAPKIGSPENITEIEVTQYHSSCEIPDEYAEKLPEPSLAQFPCSAIKYYDTVKVDPVAGKMSKGKTVLISAPRLPITADFSYVDYPIEDGVTEETSIIGLASEKDLDIGFTTLSKTTCACVYCLSDPEEIVLPKTDCGAVTKLGDYCFVNLKNTKKIVLPNTLKSFGIGNFFGCKKLKSIAFENAPSDSVDLILQKSGVLNAVITLESTYKIPKDITEIQKFAFSNCPNLKVIELHALVTEISDDAFCECKTLKRIVLPAGICKIPKAALEKANIKEVELSTGEVIEIFDPVMLDCFESAEGSIQFSYSKLVQKLPKIKKESAKYKIAKLLLLEHKEALRDELSALVEFLLSYAIGKGEKELISDILNMNLPLKLDLAKLSDRASRSGQLEVATLILSFRSKEDVEVKNVVRSETPAPMGTRRIYIKVRFENNKAYSYFCNYQVSLGDKVFVPGKMAGLPGEVVEILSSEPSGRAAMYTLSVEKAFNITEEDVGDFSL